LAKEKIEPKEWQGAARSMAFVNEKGGTGKTTLAVHTAAWLAREGKRVLLVDVDTQGHAGKTLGVDVRALKVTVADLLLDPAVALDRDRSPLLVGVLPGLDLIPANKALADLPERIGLAEDRLERLRHGLAPLKPDYDFILFDAPPSLGLLTRNVMMAAEEVVVPVALTYLSLDGCAEVKESVETIRREQGHPKLGLAWVVPTLARRTRLASEILQKLEAYFPGQVSPSLGFNVQIDEAQSAGQTIWEYAPWSRGAQMLEQIAKVLTA